MKPRERMAALERRVFCCCCGSTRKVELHHVKHRSQGGHDDGVIPLCESCHREHHQGDGRLAFAEHNDGLLWSYTSTRRVGSGVCRFWDPDAECVTTRWVR